MASAKDIIVKPITSKSANRVIKKIHYSGSVTPNSQVHLGIFLDGKCGGAIQYGPSIDKRKVMPLVRRTKWNEFLELNRFATADWLPKNTESRALAVSFKILKKNYPWLKWIISFADATQCGDGTIYRATGFVLTGINRNSTIYRLPSGETKAKHGTSKTDFTNATKMEGYQLRYIKFLDKSYRQRLTVAEIPYEKIDEVGAGMYKGEKISYKARNQAGEEGD